jgi:hypothetical protein
MNIYVNFALLETLLTVSVVSLYSHPIIFGILSFCCLSWALIAHSCYLGYLES